MEAWHWGESISEDEGRVRAIEKDVVEARRGTRRLFVCAY